MGNNSKHKTRKILAATATVTILATGMIFHRMSLRSKRSSKKFIDIIAKEKSVKSENRTFTVPEKGC